MQQLEHDVWYQAAFELASQISLISGAQTAGEMDILLKRANEEFELLPDGTQAKKVAGNWLERVAAAIALCYMVERCVQVMAA